MGQEQYKSNGPEGQRTQKEKPIEKDRASAKFDSKINNTPAMSWKDSKPSPASRPV